MLNLDIWVFNRARLTKEHLSYLVVAIFFNVFTAFFKGVENK